PGAAGAVPQDDPAQGGRLDLAVVDARTRPADDDQLGAGLDDLAGDVRRAPDDHAVDAADPGAQLGLGQGRDDVNLEAFLLQIVHARGGEPVGDEDRLHGFSAKTFWAARTLAPKSTGTPSSASTCSSAESAVIVSNSAA